MCSDSIALISRVVICRGLAPALIVAMMFIMTVHGKDSAPTKEKHVIGATALVTETDSGFTFPARIDTGAETCSLHVERIVIEDKTARRLRNVGKSIRILVKDQSGKSHWIESVVADAIRVKSSSLPGGDYDHRYKVRLTLEWQGVRKEVLVTLNDRTDMEYPLLLGRNFLRGDFLVDVGQDSGKG
jgi:hypothetical protein